MGADLRQGDGTIKGRLNTRNIAVFVESCCAGEARYANYSSPSTVSGDRRARRTVVADTAPIAMTIAPTVAAR
jgi:hypothetical protein